MLRIRISPIADWISEKLDAGRTARTSKVEARCHYKVNTVAGETVALGVHRYDSVGIGTNASIDASIIVTGFVSNLLTDLYFAAG